MFDALVTGNENGEASRFGLAKQHAILQTSPRLLLYCSNIVSNKVPGQLPRQLFIEKNQQVRLPHREQLLK